MYFKDAHAAILVYSVTDEASFKQLPYWLEQLQEHANREDLIPIIVGNKNDVEKEDRRIDFKSGKNFAESKGLHFYETSAISNDSSVADLFKEIANKIYKGFQAEDLQDL